MFALNVCMCTLHMPDAYGSQRRALNPLDRELQMAVSCPVSAGNGMRPL